MDDKTLVLTMEDGKEVTCDILFTYHSDQFEKDYVIFSLVEKSSFLQQSMLKRRKERALYRQ